MINFGSCCSDCDTSSSDMVMDLINGNLVIVKGGTTLFKIPFYIKRTILEYSFMDVILNPLETRTIFTTPHIAFYAMLNYVYLENDTTTVDISIDGIYTIPMHNSIFMSTQSVFNSLSITNNMPDNRNVKIIFLK